MNLREARRENLSTISYHTSRKDDAKTQIAELRAKYKGKGVRVVLVTEPCGNGYHRHNSYYVFGNEICAALVNKERMEKEVSMFGFKFQALEEKYRVERERLTNELNKINEDIRKYDAIIAESQNKELSDFKDD